MTAKTRALALLPAGSNIRMIAARLLNLSERPALAMLSIISEANKNHSMHHFNDLNLSVRMYKEMLVNSCGRIGTRYHRESPFTFRK